MKPVNTSIFLIVLFLFLFTQTLFAQCPPSVRAISIISLTSTNADGCADGTISIELNPEAAGYALLSYSLSGAMNVPPSNFDSGSVTHTISNLTSGNYTVTVNAYCLSVGVIEATVSQAITVGGSYTAPAVSTTVQRKALAECIPSGILRFTRSNGGVAPYKVTITNAPDPAMNGREYIFPVSSPLYIDIFNCLPGTYTYTFEDACTQRSGLTIELPVVSSASFVIGNNTDFSWYPDNNDRITCNTLHARSNSINSDLAPYAIHTDTLQKYFNFSYRIGSSGIEIPVLPYGNGNANIDATPVNYSDWRGQTITTTQTLNPAIVPVGCVNIPLPFIYNRIIPSLGNDGSYFFPITFPVPEQCLPGVYFPYSQNSRSLFCFPVSYQVVDETGTPVVDLTGHLLNAESLVTPTEKDSFYLAEGNYKIHILSDASGADWNDINFQIGLPTAWNGDPTRYHTEHLYAGYPWANEEDQFYAAPSLYYGGSSNAFPQGFTVKFTAVPPIPTELAAQERVVHLNDEYTSTRSESTLQVNMYNNGQYILTNSLKYMVPGDYEIEVTQPCRGTTTKTFTITDPFLSDWDYTVSRSCSGEYLLTPKAGVKMNVMGTDNGATPRINYQGNTAAAAILANGTNSLVLPGPGVYKIGFFSPRYSISITNSLNYAFFVRDVTVDFIEMGFDYTQTLAYWCKGGTAVVRGMAHNGNAPYTYTLQKESVAGNGDWQDIVGTMQTLGEGVPYLINNQPSLVEGTAVRIKVSDECVGGGTTTTYSQMVITSLNSIYHINAYVNCIEDKMTLSTIHLPAADYQWYFNNDDDDNLLEANKIAGATSYTLEITEDVTSHFGKYTCVALPPGCDIELIASIEVNSCISSTWNLDAVFCAGVQSTVDYSNFDVLANDTVYWYISKTAVQAAENSGANPVQGTSPDYTNGYYNKTVGSNYTGFTKNATHGLEEFYIRIKQNGATDWANKMEVDTIRIYLVPDTLVWTGNKDANWNDYENWNYPKSTTLADYATHYDSFKTYLIPHTCTDVLIPAGISRYPNLEDLYTDYSKEYFEQASCGHIWFNHGGEVARTDSLHYTEAYVQLKLQSNEWYMLSMPLKNMYAGDFYVNNPNPIADGYKIEPMLFNVANPETGSLTTTNEYKWTGSFNTADEKFYAGQGVAIWINKISTNYIDHDSATFQFPKSDPLYYYYYMNGTPTGEETDPLDRTKKNRFIYEETSNKAPVDGLVSLVFSPVISAGQAVLVGNPFMSHIKFDDFYDLNHDYIEREYKLAMGISNVDGKVNTLSTYSYNGLSYTSLIQPSKDDDPDHKTTNWVNSVDLAYIPPMQSFIVISKGASIPTLKADITKTVTQPTKSLRSAATPIFCSLEITAEKDAQSMSKSLLIYNENASSAYLPEEDSYTLFSLSSLTPVIVYTRSSDGYALDINSIGNFDQPVAVGIRTSQKGEIRLRFSGAEQFAGLIKIFLHDIKADKVIDLSWNTEYVFTKDEDDLYVENRLFLTFDIIADIHSAKSASSISVQNLQGQSVRIVSNDGSPLRKIQIMDAQGRVLVTDDVQSSTYTFSATIKGIYFLCVTNSEGTEVKKIVIT